MSSRSSLTLLAILTLFLAACDRQAPEGAQGQDDAASFVGQADASNAGALMPALSLTDPAGRELNLGALQGRPVLLNLWATWCAPCIVEMPMLDELADELDGAVRVVTVSQDLQGASRVEPFFAQRDFRHLEPWLDPDNALSYRVESDVLPTTILYDASGREVWRIVGEYDWSSAAAREAVAEALE